MHKKQARFCRGRSCVDQIFTPRWTGTANYRPFDFPHLLLDEIWWHGSRSISKARARYAVSCGANRDVLLKLKGRVNYVEVGYRVLATGSDNILSQFIYDNKFCLFDHLLPRVKIRLPYLCLFLFLLGSERSRVGISRWCDMGNEKISGEMMEVVPSRLGSNRSASQLVGNIKGYGSRPVNFFTFCQVRMIARLRLFS